MLEIKKGVELKEDGDLYIRKEFRNLDKYEMHLAKMASVKEENRKKHEENGQPVREFTLTETAARDMIDEKIEKMYQAFDDAVRIAPPAERSYFRGKVRARLVYNEKPLFFERPDELLERCVERAKLFGMAYLVPGAKERILEEVDDANLEVFSSQKKFEKK